MAYDSNYKQIQTTSSKELTVKAKDITDGVMTSISALMKDGKISAAKGYDVGNAVNMAMIQVATSVKDKAGRPALEVCTKGSIARCVLDMVLQGLMPERNQCWFIVYGDALTLQRSYFGTVATLKRVMPYPIHVTADVIREGDQYIQDFTPYGERYVKGITTDLMESAGKPIKAVYCNIFKEGTEELLGSAFMSMEQVKTSWSHSKTYRSEGSSPHNQEPDEMAKRTAIVRACKLLLKSSIASLNEATVDAFNRTTDGEFDNDMEVQNEQKPEKKTLSFKERHGIPEKTAQSVSSEETKTDTPKVEKHADEPRHDESVKITDSPDNAEVNGPEDFEDEPFGDVPPEEEPDMFAGMDDVKF